MGSNLLGAPARTEAEPQPIPAQLCLHIGAAAAFPLFVVCHLHSPGLDKPPLKDGTTDLGVGPCPRGQAAHSTLPLRCTTPHLPSLAAPRERPCAVWGVALRLLRGQRDGRQTVRSSYSVKNLLSSRSLPTRNSWSGSAAKTRAAFLPAEASKQQSQATC